MTSETYSCLFLPCNRSDTIANHFYCSLIYRSLIPLDRERIITSHGLAIKSQRLSIPPPSPVDAPYTCCIFLLCLRELWCSGWAAFAVWQATTKIGLSNVSLSIAVCGDQRNWQIQRSIHFWSIWCCDLQDPFPHDHASSFSWIRRFPIVSFWIKRQPFLPLMKLSISASRFQSYYIDALNW